MPHNRFIAMLAAIACIGCSHTRTLNFGVLPGGAPLVRLVVTEDREVVGRECRGEETARFLGCQILQPVFVGDRTLHTVVIVRYTDVLPSEMATEIEAHEMCHAAAALQEIADPCHAGNNGIVQSALPPGHLRIHVR